MFLSIQFQPISLYNLGFICNIQWVEMTLYKIANPFIKTHAGWKIMLEGFQIYLVWYPRLKGVETISQVAQQIWPDLTLLRLNWIHCLVGGFYAFHKGFHEKYIWNPWSMFFHPAKVLWKGFAILIKIVSANCDEEIPWTVNRTVFDINQQNIMHN